MKNLLLILPSIMALIVNGQNVGIGTSTPSGKLDIRSSASAASPSLLITDSTYKAFGVLRIQNVDYPGKYMQFSGYKGVEASAETYLELRSDSVVVTTFKGNGYMGVGNSNPQQRLDIDGNINLTGSIMANGVDGTPEQVLMKNGSGQLSWGDPGGYKNMATLLSGSGTWIVPAGVTRIAVEVWGSGGGGSAYGGGGSGSYIRGVLNVTPGNAILYGVGVGGSGSSNAGQNGGYSYIEFGSYGMYAYGGYGSQMDVPNSIVGVGDGGLFAASGFNNYMGVIGQPGKFKKIEFMAISPTVFYEIVSGGDGGDAPFREVTGGKGRYRINNTTAGTVIRQTYASAGKQPGGGGGSGIGSVTGVTGTGTAGGNGMIIFHY
jgi:hypothetical protein